MLKRAIVVAALAATAIGLFLILNPFRSSTSSPVSSLDMRTFVLVRDNRATTNGGVLHRVSGAEMTPPTIARVLTDTNCQADAQGISHCLNELGLAGGRTVLVRHDHNMSVVPCLTPGTFIRIVPG